MKFLFLIPGAARKFLFIVSAAFLLSFPRPVAGDELLEFDFSPPAATIAEHISTAWPEQAGNLALADRTVLRPGERWAEMIINLETPGDRQFDDHELRAFLIRPLDRETIARTRTVPGAKRGLLRADLRRAKVESAVLRLELWSGGEPADFFETGYSVLNPEHSWPEAGVPVRIDFPEGAGNDPWPVVFGIPAPAGAVWGIEELSLVDGDGRPVPAQKEMAARWAPGGAVKWARFEALAEPGREFFVVRRPDGEDANPAEPVTVGRNGETVTVEVAGARYVLRPGPSPVAEIHLDGSLLATTQGARGLFLVDQAGREARATDDDEVRVEAAGPAAASIRFEGFYRTADGEEIARHITRLEFSAGRPEARATHTLVLTRDTNETWLREIGWEMTVMPGAAPAAFFSDGRALNGTVGPISLEADDSAVVFQEDGLRLGMAPRPESPERWKTRTLGENLFTVRASGQEVHRGDEMGDWAALAGADGGLLVNCREAARQHPKEFEISGSRLTLMLFSNRGGQELDFRTGALADRWGLAQLHEQGLINVEDRNLPPDRMERIMAHRSNAAGWAKTHEILFAPLSPGADAAALPALGRRHSGQVYAHVSPEWIYRSRVFGGLHPRDPENYPEIEAVYRAYLAPWLDNLPGHWLGFVDYYAGPMFSFPGRFRNDYYVRIRLWDAYARSGDRRLRELAESASRAAQDNYFAHWDAPGKERGLVIGAPGGRGGWRKSDLPFYWEESTGMNPPSSPVARPFHDYYLTGNRRARDIMEQHAQAFLGHLSECGTDLGALATVPAPEGRRAFGRVFNALHPINLVLGYTWDQRLRAAAEFITTHEAYDPDGELYLSSLRPYFSSTYKTPSDVEYMIESWETLGSTRHYRMALATAREWSERAGIESGRLNGIHASFLYRETSDPRVAEACRQYLLRTGAVLDWETGRAGLGPLLKAGLQPHGPSSFDLRRIPQAQDVMALAGVADIEDGRMRPAVSWLDFDADAAPVRIFVHKPGNPRVSRLSPHYDHAAHAETETGLELMLRRRTIREVEYPGSGIFRRERIVLEDGTSELRGFLAPFGDSVSLQSHTRALAGHAWAGQDLHRVTETSGGKALVRIPRDAPGGVYEIVSGREGDHVVFADWRVPLAVYAPGGWRPAAMRPPVPVFFRVPESGGRIILENGARLFLPSGEPFRGGEELSGPFELPGTEAGLWRFESVDPGLVSVEGLPGFFSMGDPAFYLEFEPGRDD